MSSITWGQRTEKIRYNLLYGNGMQITIMQITRKCNQIAVDAYKLLSLFWSWLNFVLSTNQHNWSRQLVKHFLNLMKELFSVWLQDWFMKPLCTVWKIDNKGLFGIQNLQKSWFIVLAMTILLWDPMKRKNKRHCSIIPRIEPP